MGKLYRYSKDGNVNYSKVKIPTGVSFRYLYPPSHRKDGPAIIDSWGDEEWMQNGIQHRVSGPCLIDARGSEFWKYNGGYHRIGGPAIFTIGEEGTREEWYWHNKRHRIGGPAIIEKLFDGTVEREGWFYYGERHRIGGPAFVTKHLKEWYYFGGRHRVGGPAVENSKTGNKEWWYQGKRHNLEGPAIIAVNQKTGKTLSSYYIHGKYYSKKDFLAFVKGNP